jgi:uncharacterized protein YgbK (DUF1537 family)
MTLDELLQKFPKAVKIPGAREQIRKRNRELGSKIVVLDDDPTGCQTVSEVQLFLDWENMNMEEALEEECFFILTNTRAYPEGEAVRVNREIAQKLRWCVPEQRKTRLVSRSDSTLRGHFYAETVTLLDVLGPFDGIIVVPYFKEGGRLTVFDTHYLVSGREMIEVNRTEYSRDPIFGFQSAHLPTWIEEKSRGVWKREKVISISIEDIRVGGPEKVCSKLVDFDGFRPVVVNSLCDEDLEIFVLGLIEAENQGRRFLYRTAASFVKVRAGIPDRDLFIPPGGRKGLIVVGSYTRLTTAQVHDLLEKFSLKHVEITIASIFSHKSHDYAREIAEQIDSFLSRNESVVILTERNYAFPESDLEERLQKAQVVSSFLVHVVRNITEKPDFFIAKGGITSYDLAKKALHARKSMVLGQIAPGVPVWKLDENSKYPGLIYIVFPGNVGDTSTLSSIYSLFVHPKEV